MTTTLNRKCIGLSPFPGRPRSVILSTLGLLDRKLYLSIFTET